MGADKLLLPWGEGTLLERAIENWRRAEAFATVVVVPRSNHRACELAEAAGAVIVAAENSPPEMKDSVRLALAALENQFLPTVCDWWGLAPVDLPTWSPATAKRLFDVATKYDVEARNANEIDVVVPKYGNRRGHPALFRWSLADAVERLPKGRGVDFLLETANLAEVSFAEDEYPPDADDPDAFRRLQQRAENEPE